MSAFLKLLELFADELSRLLRLQRAREIQEKHDANHTDPQGRFADRFGAASGQLPDSPKPSSELPATHTQADMEPRR
ncbi:hypothetical protein ACET6V_04380 [Aeromonas caviae]|uniref:hypothetical protein n=1 Tax=Aeromonas caviae TaxID=648 RepID=UPI0038D02ACA